MTLIEKANQLFSDNNTHPTVSGILEDGTRIKLRLFKTSNGDVCHYRKGSRRSGYYLSCYPHLTDIIPITTKKSPEQKWIDGWKKVQSKLRKSGLWSEISKEIDIALSLGYKKMNEAYDIYWKINDEKEKIKLFQDNFPSLIEKNDKNEPYIVTTILWHYARHPKVKKMRFSKYKAYNEATLQAIQNAMDKKEPFHADGRTNYDISFEYAPQKSNRAWYSEEFKGCGNGHYWHAISSTHALFSEDD